MTTQQKNNLDYFKSLVPLLSVFIIFFYVGVWTNSAETKMFDSPSQKETIINHSKDVIIHMPLQKKQEIFVTRNEYNITLKNIEKSLDRLEKAIEK